ncbi:MAG: hypothetical protein AAF497_22615, partial [Planctomycetota bacterium]
MRIYPDDIHVDTHEENLTLDELSRGKDYWITTWRAGGSSDESLAAWRALLRSFGAPRAAWIVRTLRPVNAHEKPRDLIPAGEPLDPEPVFPEVPTKLDSWSRAPQVSTMPDRFVAVGIKDGQTVFQKEGVPIPSPLVVGPNPSQLDPSNEGFRPDEASLNVDQDMRWMTDFDEAVRIGMGMEIDLPPIASNGFDQLFVIGVRLSADERIGKRLIESLVEAHHYAIDGFGLIPQGTATNNTDGVGAGFETSATGDDESMRFEVGEPLFKTRTIWQQKRDGQILSDALGIDPAVLHHIEHADGFDRRDARAMNVALWPATLGYFLSELMSPTVSPETIDDARNFFVRHVSGRGALPAIRVGNQPYGVIATSAFSRWDFRVSPNPDFSSKLVRFLKEMDGHWNSLLPRVSRYDRLDNAEANLMDVLGLHAGSAEFHHRFATSIEHLSNALKLQQLQGSAIDLASLLETAHTQLADQFQVGVQPAVTNNIFYKSQTLLDGPFVDPNERSETTFLSKVTDSDENYLIWLATRPFDTIRREDFGRLDGNDLSSPNALLYMMLRHAVMTEFWTTGVNFYESAGLDAPRSEPPLLYVRKQKPGQSKFSVLYREASQLSEKLPSIFSDPQKSVVEQLSSNVALKRPESSGLRDLNESLKLLSGLSTAGLTRVFSEHLDLCSYRLDA